MSDFVKHLRGDVMTAAFAFVNSHFGNDGPQPHMKIPADPENDSDLVLTRGIKHAADHIEALEAAIAERDRLLDNLTITIGAIVVAAGGKVEVPQSVFEEIQAFELEKAPGSDGGVIYATRMRGEVTDA